MLAAGLLGRGGVAAVQEGAEESAPFAKRPEPAAIRHVWEEQGTGDSLPAALDWRSHRRPPGGGGALGRPPRCPVPSPRAATGGLVLLSFRSSSVGTRDRWVVQVSLIIINSTGLAPFPRLSAPPHSSHTPSPPLSGGSRSQRPWHTWG